MALCVCQLTEAAGKLSTYMALCVCQLTEAAGKCKDVCESLSM
jgi:hypothetical protein